MTRRQWLLGFAAGALLGGFRKPGFAAQASPMKEIEAMRRNWRALLPEGAKVPSPGENLKLSREEWRKRLTAEQFEVLRNEGTEPPGTSPLNDEKRPGVFVCAGCGLPLFTSAMKYESGTGWPSFFTTIPGVFGTKKDYVLVIPRIEYHCIRCSGHHGHVFDDGPPPTGERWCNNGIALRFLPRSGKA